MDMLLDMGDMAWAGQDMSMRNLGKDMDSYKDMDNSMNTGLDTGMGSSYLQYTDNSHLLEMDSSMDKNNSIDKSSDMNPDSSTDNRNPHLSCM